MHLALTICMAMEANSFLNHLSDSLVGLLSDIVCERSLFRTSKLLLTPATAASGDFHLSLRRCQMAEDEKGTFHLPIGADGFLVYRNPSAFTATYALEAPNLTVRQQLSAYDRLHSYFFDNKSIQPFVAKGYAPLLEERLSSKRAGLNPVEVASAFPFFFGFQYSALYHSGNPLREEVKTKNRVVDFLKPS